MRPTMDRDYAALDQGNWFKDTTTMRSYTAQRDQFLKMHERPAGRTSGQSTMEDGRARNWRARRTARRR